jgi:dienelactone hydrolase
MVSRGYVVAAIQHPGIAGAVVFPDGRVAPAPRNMFPPGLTPEQILQRMSDQARRWIEVGAADERFVFDRLTRENLGVANNFALAGRLDVSRVAVMGHSAGGASAARTCELDTRFQACVDLDGALAPVVALPEGTIQHPLLFLEAYHDQAQIAGTAEQKLAFLQKEKEQLWKCPAGSYDVLLKPPAIMHGSFSDAFILNPENTPEQTAQALNNLDLAESYILAFLDKGLKHIPAPLLDAPQAQPPDSSIQRFGH